MRLRQAHAILEAATALHTMRPRLRNPPPRCALAHRIRTGAQVSETRFAVTIIVTAVNLTEADLDTLREEIEDAAAAYKGDVAVDSRDYPVD